MKHENQKWIYTSIGIVALITWYILKKLVAAVFYAAKVSVPVFFEKISIIDIGSLIVVGIAAFFILKNEKILDYVNDVIIELKKVTWPSKKETTGSTTVVLIVVFIFSAILGFFDLIWTKLLQLVF